MYSFLELTLEQTSDSIGDSDGPCRKQSPSVRHKRGRRKQTGEVFNFCLSLCQCVLILELSQAENLDPFGDGPQRTRSPSVKPNRRRGKQTGEVFNF